MSGTWVWLSRNRGEVGDHSVGCYSALLTPERIAAGVSDPGWDVHHGAGGPGFVQYNGESGWTTDYEVTHEEGIELLVVDRTWHGVRQDDVELAQEFRLLFNLWEDRGTRTFYDFDGSGNPIEAVVVEEQGVRALRSLVRRFQAAKQMYLALYLDSTLWSGDLPSEEHRWETRGSHLICGYYRPDPSESAGGQPFSRLLGKRLIPPPPREECGIAPFERAKQYEKFSLGTNDVGEELLFTSDPDELANYFGANPNNPHYLTPVYFRSDVLNRYYADTDRYSVEDGLLRCAGLWALRIDNDQDGHLMVFLGDLGRDMPVAEARHWRSHNIAPPENGPSETLVRRAFYGEFTDPQSVGLRFPRVYAKTNEAWAEAFGWPLFRALHHDDRHLLSSLHVPFGEGASEFDEQILCLAKLLVDSLNERELAKHVTNKSKDLKGLGKLEQMLGGLGVLDARSLLGSLADIQGLRSRGAAHLKGSDFDISIPLNGLGRKAGFAALMQRAVDTLDSLRGIAEERATAGPVAKS